MQPHSVRPAAPASITAPPKPRCGERFLKASAGKPGGRTKPPGGGMSWRKAFGGGAAMLGGEKAGKERETAEPLFPV